MIHPSHSSHIRQADPNDIPAIAEVARKSWQAAFTAFLSPEQLAFDLARDYTPEVIHRQMETGQIFMVLENQANRIVGFAFLSVEPGEPEHLVLNKLYLDPAIKSRGYGKQLLNAVCHYGKDHGYTTLKLWVNRKNEAVRFYEKQGFTITGEDSNCIGNNFWRYDYVMEKSLSDNPFHPTYPLKRNT